MPWRGPTVPGEFPTLGYLVADWIEAFIPIPDGDHQGQPFVLTDEQLRWLLHYYRLRPDITEDQVVGKPSRAFVSFRGGQLVDPQKKGKGPLSAAQGIAEAEGPVLFAGWDANGEPVGRSWATPWIQVTAVSEGQTENVWTSLLPMIELGDLKADIPDTGETRINLASGGRIQPVTSSAKTRLGQRITCAIQDETHSWTAQNGGHKLADTQRRNLAGMGGRFIETTNAWDPVEESVAQQTFESKAPGVYRQKSEAGPGSIRNARDRSRMLRNVYGDAWWVDLQRIDAEIVTLLEKGEVGQASRFFLNRPEAAEGAAFDRAQWDTLADGWRDFVVPANDLITIGVDGARWDDAFAIVATHVESGFQWPLGIWEVPPNAPDDYEHPEDEADGVVLDAWARFNVWRVYVDPQRIEPLFNRWQGRWGEKNVLPWYTNRPKPIAYAVRKYRNAISGKDPELHHNGDDVMARHVGNARRQPLNVLDDDRRQMFTISKDRPGSPRKIDAAMAGVLSWEARGDAIADGALERRPAAPSQLVTF